MGLDAVFRDAIAAAGAIDRPAWVDALHVDAQLADLCARGRAAFPNLELADETFVRHLGAVVARDRAGAAALADRVAGDLFLACACLARVPGAVEAFDQLCTPAIRAAVARLAPSEAARDEIV